jgi:hypothetical protein
MQFSTTLIKCGISRYGKYASDQLSRKKPVEEDVEKPSIIEIGDLFIRPAAID